MAKTVTLYTQTGWAPCHSEKEFLLQKGVEVIEKNIREDPAALVELQNLGARATPVAVIGDQVVMGFDRAKLEALLAE